MGCGAWRHGSSQYSAVARSQFEAWACIVNKWCGCVAYMLYGLKTCGIQTHAVRRIRTFLHSIRILGCESFEPGLRAQGISAVKLLFERSARTRCERGLKSWA